jgi:periplasmic protein CpxP/Spy
MTHINDRTTHASARAVSVVVFMLASAGLVAGSSITADAGGSPGGGLMAQAAPAPATPDASSPAPKVPGQQTPTSGPAALVEGRISELHQQLHITPAQESQFRAYADVMRDNAQAMHALFQQRAQNTDTSAVSMLRWYAQLTAAHAEAVGKLVPVFEALYQSMSDKQKKAADAVFQQLRQRRAPRRAG